MSQPEPVRPVWIDGEPTMEAIAAAVWEQGRTEGTVVADDPRSIAAVVAAIRTAAGQDQPLGAASTGTAAPKEPQSEPRCDVMFQNGEQCAKPADHRPAGSDDPCTPAETLRLHERRTRWQAAARKAKVPADRGAIRAYMAVADEEQQGHAAATKYWFDAADERREEIARLRAELEQARATTAHDLLPTWEAMYEPGNVSDYLIGYANGEDTAKGAAEAWLRSEMEAPGRLEWVAEPPPCSGEYDQRFELSRHDPELGECATGINVRHRSAP
ncbi:hypothetical protein [Streptomyces scopuliridis]|uniref:hypothetical protein n=1 Tax=Streptomyces scopuliridis TaxID=452529 RepID=UPI0036AD50F4